MVRVRACAAFHNAADLASEVERLASEVERICGELDRQTMHRVQRRMRDCRERLAVVIDFVQDTKVCSRRARKEQVA